MASLAQRGCLNFHRGLFFPQSVVIPYSMALTYTEFDEFYLNAPLRLRTALRLCTGLSKQVETQKELSSVRVGEDIGRKMA